MDRLELNKKLELIRRNVQETVQKQELDDLVASKEHPTAYVGYEPSGKIHIGHVLTVNKLIDLQKAGFEITVLLADLHAYLNQKGTLDEVRETADYNKRCFIALGLDRERTNFVYGSDFQLEPDYMLNVLKLTRATSLNRAKRSMDEVGRKMDDPKVSQMAYPIMQAVDIAMLGLVVYYRGSILGVMPPLIIDKEIANDIVGIIDKALDTSVSANIARKARLVKEFAASKLR